MSVWRADRQPPTVERTDDAAPTHVEGTPAPDGQSVSASEANKATVTNLQAKGMVVEEDGGRQDDRGFLRGISDWFEKSLSAALK